MIMKRSHVSGHLVSGGLANRSFFLSGLALTVIGWAGIRGLSAASADIEFFERKIRPVLAKRCFDCHSHQADKLKGGLLLDSRNGFLNGGDSGPVATPEKSEESLFIEAIRYQNIDLQMPPKSKLSDQEIADFEKWVSMGLPWPDEAPPISEGMKAAFDLQARKASHWAWQPVKKVTPPLVKASQWVKNPVDAFVLHRLEGEGLAPASSASKRSLIRRLSYLLRGLAPAPDEIDAFEADLHRQAYERVVDELLASPQFGERWSRHWLDLVRYAETMGHEFDYAIPNAWRYRDYMIRAFNQDVPYDLVVKEHIAGDLLDIPRRNPENGMNESLVGTGFYWLGQQVHSPVDIEMNQLEVLDNQIDVLSKTFLGMTVSCARCHDHKFDAISTKDFYSLYGILSSSRYHEGAVNAPETWSRASRQLKAKQQAVRKVAASTWLKSGALLAEYIEAGLGLLSGAEVAEADATVSLPDVLFEDFETAANDRWEGKGDAFSGDSFGRLENRDEVTSEGMLGRGFASSNPGGTDEGKKERGRLVSAPFTIDRDYIHFLISGGADRRRTTVNLLVDGSAVRTATGKQNNRFQPACFDVRVLHGREARIEVKDEATGGWGYVEADHFVFSQRQRLFGVGNQLLPSLESISVVAAAKDLDEAVLLHWVEALDEARSDGERHPLFVLTRLADLEGQADVASFKDHWEVLGKKYFASRADSNEIKGVVMADVSEDGFDGWFFDGPALADAQTEVGELLLSGARAEASVEALLSIHSARFSRRLQGSLRSPTFEVDERYLHVLAAGESSRINVVIENFNLIRSPIYGGLKKQLEHTDQRWVTFDLDRWRGHEAYLEIKDTTPGDLAGGRFQYEADGWFSISRVVASSESSLLPPPSVSGDYLPRIVEAPENLAEFLDACEQKTLVLLEKWSSCDEPDAGESLDERPALSADDLRWLNWLAENELLFGSEDSDLFKRAQTEYVALADQVKAPELVLSMTEGSGVDQVVWLRGNPRMRGEVAPRGPLEALGLVESLGEGGSGRLELAEHIVDAENPLTARVYVNRVWHYVFGRGIVLTPDNFGVLGQEPTHPELLDWLAHWFVTEGEWSTKRLIRLLVTSATYQMASEADPYYAERDPDNRWFHKMPVRRLEGEAIRDAVLAVSDDLDLKQFGEPVPVHLTPFMTGRGRPGRNGPLDGEHRRTVYQEVRRNFLSPTMLAFDTPIPHTTIGKRSVSNVPAQALILMNDPLVIHQAQRWAEKLLAASPEMAPRDRISQIYYTALGRKPSREESRNALDFIESQGTIYGEDEGDRSLRIWADFCHVVFNVKEFIFLD
ncbi:MAG: hypothetical protein M2R45_04106 [Verrucomicrobia subdivision 3 bacterium]|nr:hypothetical protein [Limisphaerales bacterium]MCS1417093.1 hypothetical protein [Limisphaerales bacterium]